MALRHRGQFRTAGKKRLTDWAFGVDILNQTIDASEKILGTTSLTTAEQQTIVRVHGVLHVTLITASVAGAGFLGAAGIALVNTDAFGQGINSIPGPLTDAHWDSWLWHSFWDVRALTGTIGDGANSGAAHQRIAIDSKAMRRWDPAETLVIMVEGVEVGAASATLNCDTRILVKAA